MSASISTKRGSIGMAYMKRAAGLVKGAAGDYFKSAMPTTDQVLSGATATISGVTQKLANTTQSVFPKLRQLKAQTTFKNIENWFLTQEGEFGDEASLDAEMSFDIEGLEDSAAEIVDSQIADWDRNASKVSKSIVESSHKMVEAQMVSTANISTSIDKQTATIASGFDSTNKLLGQILEVMTKNTATLIEATVAQNEQKSAKDSMLASGKFNIGDYKNIIGKNFQNSELAALSMIPQMLSGGTWKQVVTPEAIFGSLFNIGVNKAAPNLKKNMKALDDAVNSVIMTSLIRLGENQSFGPKGMISRLFGIDASRKDIDTSRSSLQIKSISWDTVSREALTNALPGYMRQILIQLGGPDMVYDYRSRTFRTKSAIKKEFEQASTSTGNLYRASNRVRSGMTQGNGDQADMQMLYDLMMSDLGSNYSGGAQRTFLKSLTSERKVAEYVRELTDGMELSRGDLQTQDQFIKNLAKTLKDEWAQIDIANQAASSEVIRRTAGQNYVKTADNYNVDLSEFQDSQESNRRTIIDQYGHKLRAPGGAQVKETVSALRGATGTDYTNRALYEIYRRLETGINVFKVGEFEQLRRNHYTKKKALKPPDGYRAPTLNDHADDKEGKASISGINPGKYDDGTNLLKNNEQEDGSTEELTKGQRFARWGKNRGKQFAGAMFSGNPEDVKNLFGAVVKDITDVAGGEMKKGITKINNSFGNVSGYLKHKMFGTEYTYDTGETDEDGNPIKKTIAKNEKGGVLGFVSNEIMGMFKTAKGKAGDWFKDVRSYFDYGDKSEDADVVSKRKKLIGASVGAFAGAGLLGGPIGLLVGGLAGNALTSIGFGKKIKDFLFGTDKETGKPTGILSKTADAIISPIQYQVGKTVAFAGAMMKKNIFGPLSDLGLAVKDRIENHVKSIFDDVKEAALAPFKAIGKWMAKGVAKATAGIANIAHKAGASITGGLTRGAIGVGTGSVGFLQNHMAKKISKNSFHKLKKGELYPLRVGQRYYDPNEETADKKHQRSMVHILSEDNPRVSPLEELKGELGVLLNGDDDKEWRPYARDYLKWRRKQRNEKIDEDLKSSNFYKKGGYKAWHSKELMRRQEAKDRLTEAMAESEKETAEATQTISDTTADIRDVLNSERIPGSSFKTHDQGLWDRVDIIIKTLTGKDAPTNSDNTIKKEPKRSKSKDVAKKDEPDGGGAVLNGEKIVEALTANSRANERDQFATTAMGAAINASTADENLSKEEHTANLAIINEAEKNDSNKRSIGAKLRDLLGLQRKRRNDEQEEKGEKKKTIWDYLLNGIGGLLGSLGSFILNHPVMAGIAGAAIALGAVDWENIGGIISWAGNILSTIWDNVKKLFNLGDSDTDAVTTGMNIPLSTLDTQVKDKFDLAIPGASLYHNKRDGAGNRIVNSAMTEAKEELLWKTNLRSTFVNGATPAQMINGALANHYQSKAISKSIQSGIEAGSGNTGKANRLMRSARKSQEKADHYNEQAASNRNTTGGGVIHNFGRVATLGGLSYGAGALGGVVAENLGMSEEGVAVVQNVTTGAAAAGLTWNMMTSTMKGKKSFVDKVLDGLIKAFQWLGKRLAGEKAMKGIENIASTVSNFADNVVKAIRGKIEKYVGKLLEKLGFSTTEQAVSAATLGIAIGVGALNGLASGVCDTEHLFGVLPNQADAGMIAISSALGAAFGALEMTPVIGWVVAIFDIIDAILISLPPIKVGPFTIGGKGIKQALAELIYKVGGGGASLAEKQEAFATEKKYYEDTYLGGSSMNDATYNDMINNHGGWVQMLWEGKTGTGEDGHLTYDEAGAVLKEGGLKNVFIGNRVKYAHDENGAVLRGANNEALTAKDRFGRTIKENEKIGDKAYNLFSNGTRFIIGGKTYKTDENGEAIYDKNGKLIEDGREKSILGKSVDFAKDTWDYVSSGKAVDDAISWGQAAWDFITGKSDDKKKGDGHLGKAVKGTLKGIGATISKPFKDVGSWFKDQGSKAANWWSGTEITNPDGTTTKTEGFKDAAVRTLGNIGATIAKPFKDAGEGIKDWWSGDVEKDENGNPLLDENGKPIRKGGFKQWAGSTIGTVTSSIAKVARGAKATVADWVLGEYERGEDGKPLVDENGKPIRKGGLAGMITTGLGKLNETIITPVKGAIDGAKTWVKDKAEWVKEGFTSAKDWLGDKAGKLWTAVSTPVKNAIDGAKEWASNTGAWLAEGASNAGAWIVDKAKGAWTAISTPVKDFVSGAKEWVGNTANYLGEQAANAGAWISEKASAAWTAISTPVKDMVTGAKDWVKDKAEWVKDKAKGAGAWIADKASTIFNTITDNVKGMANGAKDWLKDKAEWVKDGAKSAGDWIADKAKGIWDWVTGPIKELMERGEQDERDANDIAAARGGSGGPVGGPRGARIAGVGGPSDLNDIWDRGSMSSQERQAAAAKPDMSDIWVRGSMSSEERAAATEQGSTSTAVQEGGNPLNKAFGISSKYGWRTLDKGQEFHSGIDMYPTDGSRQASVGARFNGEVVSVKSNLPDSHSGLGVSSDTAGNYVIYKTNSGLTVKNFHLKANSIPSNIKPGAKISIGDKLGEMGSTGRSTGPHLHYQLESPTAKDPKGNHTFDPTSSVNGGSTISTFNDYGNGTYSADGSGTSGFSGFTSSDGTSTIGDMANGKTGLAGVLEVLKNWGKAILNKITGGLFGDESSSSSSSNLSDSGYSGGNSSLDGAMSISGSKVSNVDEFLALVAKEIGVTENPPNSNRVKYNDWFWGTGTSGPDYPWCMAFVQWCFHQAGLDLEFKTAGCGSYLSSMQKAHPNLVFKAGTGTPKPGDIAIFGNHQHTGIIEKVVSASVVKTIEGNTSGNGSQDNGGCVMRKERSTGGTGSGKFAYYIRPVDFESLKASSSMSIHSVEGDEDMYKYLRSIGYTAEAATAIVACWAHESTNSAKTVEGDFTSYFKNFYHGDYDAIANDPSRFHQYTEGIIARTPSANPSGYVASDGKKWAGLGYAQWTADRSKGLLEFAKQNNAKWYDSGTQLAFMTKEMQGSYKKTYNKMQEAKTIEDATHAFAYGYEHGSMPSSMYNARLNTARSLYPKFKNINVTSQTEAVDDIWKRHENVGGPTSEISPMQSMNRIDPDYLPVGGELPERKSPTVSVNQNVISKPVGGPRQGPATSQKISTPRFGRRYVGGPESEVPTSSYTLSPKTITPTSGVSTGTSVGSVDGKSLDGVIDMMSKILNALMAIQQNTGDSSSLLGSLNEKDFVDQGLRDSIQAAGKVSKNYAKRHTSSGTNASQVVAMARP